MACIVLEQMCREVGRPRLTALATTVHVGMTENFPINIDKHIDDMLNLGSRYINIECTMGRGICLLLGCNLPESQYVPRISVSPMLTATVGPSSSRRKAISSTR